uniref:Tc1-like transposase DDE domain-containing protein n=1 Tax=Fundulus heteroclitus TaxID=8078 RepID=A0A3Q2QYG5_FUNHE
MKFTQDNNLKHMAKSTQKQSTKHIDLLLKPTCSPDLSPVENPQTDNLADVYRRTPFILTKLDHFCKEQRKNAVSRVPKRILWSIS